MQRKSQILLRLNILFGIVVVVTALSVFSVILSKDFWVGVKEGFSEGLAYTYQGNSNTQMYPEIPIARNAGQFKLPIPLPENNDLDITARITQIDLKITGKTAPDSFLSNFLLFISLTCYVIILIILFIIILSIRKSVLRGNVFNRNNINSTRAIGILLIVSSLLFDMARYLEVAGIRDLLTGTSWQVVWEGIKFPHIITGLLILFIAEIFIIGYNMTEEQKLTI